MTGTVLRRAAGSVLAAAMAVAALASCGLPTDSQAHEINDRAITDLASPRPSITSPSNQHGPVARLYFVKNESLRPVSVTVDGPLTAFRRLTLLLNGPPRRADEKNLTTSIPPRVHLRSVDQSGSTLRVDLNDQIKSIGGSALRTAYAQLALTALDTEGVDRVRFAVDGDGIDVPTDDGNLPEVRAYNYRLELRRP